MARTFEKMEIENEIFYDIYVVIENGVTIGGYFVPKGILPIDYENATKSAENKLIALGLTDLEVKAIIGRQLF
jgi:hypothetical protein